MTAQANGGESAHGGQGERDWEARVARVWAGLDDDEPEQFREKVAALARERPAGDAAALFELACANDSTGLPQQAEPLYRRALETGLSGIRRRRAVIQLSSTLRNLGRASEALELLTAERESGVSDELDDALTCVLALTLAQLGREREGLGLVVGALARHLPRYNRSMANYGAHMVQEARADAAR